MAMKRELRDHQATGASWLTSRPRAYLADDAGLGKTLTLLAEAKVQGAQDILVVAPAAIRDMRIWPDELDESGLDLDLEVVSYHGLAKVPADRCPDVVIFDEAHKLKDRKTTWFKPAVALADRSGLVRMASGTPIPNIPTELWAPLHILRPDLPSYWNWVRQWFNVIPTKWSAYGVDGTLLGCTTECNPRDCEHWAAFHNANLEGWMLRRPREAVLRDLPPMDGHDHPVRVPMTPAQRRLYKQLKKDFYATIRDADSELTIEALTHSEQFIRLWQLSTGVGSAAPEDDPEAKHSGKLAAVEELLLGRSRPTIVACYFRNTFDQLAALCDRLGVRWAGIGGSTPSKVRAETVRSFQAGDLDVLIASVSVIGEGVTLTAADELILVERPWVPAAMEQVIRRIHRIGQSRPVTVRQLVSEGTVDEVQWGVLWAKDAAARRALLRTLASD